MTTNNQNQSNIQPVRSNFGTPTVAQAQAPPATTNETTYTKFNMDDIEFEFDDRGNLIVVPSQQAQQTSEGVDDIESPLISEETVDNNQPQPHNNSTPSDVNDRFMKLESAIFQLAQYLDSKEQTQVNNQTNNSQPNIDFQSDDWPTQIVSLINQSVSQAIDAKMKPMQNDFNSMRVRNEFQDAAAKYGTPFLDLVPEMTEIKKSDPNVSWDVLYQSMSKIRDKYNKTQTQQDTNMSPRQDSTTRTNDVTSKNGKALLANANQLRTRANQIKTESSTANANIAPQARQINSIDDAVNAALEELYG